METLVAIISKLAASVVGMALFLSFHHRLSVGAVGSKNTISNIVSGTKDVMDGTKHIGRIRYHYFNEDFVDIDDHVGNHDRSGIPENATSKQCSDILVIGVGTAMSVEGYDKVAERIVAISGSSSLVVVISDSNPDHIVKLPSSKYASLLNAIRDQLNSGLVPICAREQVHNHKQYVRSTLSSLEIGPTQEQQQQQQQPRVNFLIGGHSASGQAALEAAQKGLYDFVPDGFVGLDPYDISEKTMNFSSPLQFPTINWGFTHTTCFVKVQKAAQGAYRLSSSESGRVLYLIDNEHNGMTHCVFTDHGCGVGAFDVCPTNENFEWVHESVGESIHKFVTALRTEGRQFTKDIFELPSTLSGRVSLFVNDDEFESITDCDGDSGSESFVGSENTSIDDATDTDDSSDRKRVDDTSSYRDVIAQPFALRNSQE
jgi:hypothetical protein